MQVKEVFSFLPEVAYQLTCVESFGDRNKHISLMSHIDADFFTRELDDAVLNGNADVAVHSAKDLPCPLPGGLELYALFAAQDKTDALVSRNRLSLSRLPAGARVGTSSATRKAELLQLRPDVTVVSIRGTIEERLAQVDNGYIDALIVATCALKRLGLEGRITGILPFKTHALQGNLAVTGRKGEPELKAIFTRFDVRKTYGRVTLVGFGPGNPDLLTVGGDKALNDADVIFHDDLIDSAFLDKYRAEKIYVGKRKGKHSHSQDVINEELYRSAVSGRNTVRLKGGDPMIFAHGREEIDFLRSRLVETAVIPGISSAIALAAYTYIPLTHRGTSSSVAFVAGHPGNRAPIPNTDTIVYYMGGANIAAIAAGLIADGRDADTPAALVYNVSLPGQATYYSSLRELQFSAVKYPAPVLVVIGETVALESRRADRQNILVTGVTSEEYAGYGHIVHTPLIKIQKSGNTAMERFTTGKTDTPYDWIVFTSRYGVRYFHEWLNEAKPDTRSWANARIASTGKTTTAELNKYNIHPDMESATGSAEGLTAFFRENALTGQTILLPRSDRGLKYLSDTLEALGNKVTDMPVYTNTINPEAERVDLSRFDKIIFTSPSCVEAFVRLYGSLPERTLLTARGKTTANKLKTYIE
jgi:uroporphyrinogen III methyltransferase/synthase